MIDVAIIGGGLFGSIIAKALTSIGRKVVIYDDHRPEAGSGPAACLMRPSWFSSLGKAVYDPSLALLNELYGVQELQFKTGPLRTKVFWVPPKTILGMPHIKKSVRRLSRNRKSSDWLLTFRDESTERAGTVIVAAGIWTGLLLPEIRQRGLAGMAFLWPRTVIFEPFIKPWAPFKQVVVFNRGDGVWAGDGSAILWQNWTEARAEQSLKRCAQKVAKPPSRLFGVRPYHQDKPCLVKEVRPGLWAVSGGAKNGTLAAGWSAHVLKAALQ